MTCVDRHKKAKVIGRTPAPMRLGLLECINVNKRASSCKRVSVSEYYNFSEASGSFRSMYDLAPHNELGPADMNKMTIPELESKTKTAAYIQRELAKIEQAEKYRKKNFGIEGYIPNAVQMRAHKSIAKTINFVGGNRIGKSTFGAAELAMHLTKQYPAWFPEERRFKGPIKAMVSASGFPIVTTTIEPKIFSFLPRNFYSFKRTAQGYLSRITCKDGSTVDIKTSEMKDEAYESADWDFVWCDEPQSQFKYQAIRRGLIDRGGYCVITFTPLTEPWMKEELVDKSDGKRIETITATMYDNLTDIAGNKILNEEAVRDFEASIPEEIRKTRISGQFFHLRGIIYQGFSDAHCVAGDQWEYDKDEAVPVIAVLDPHDRKPHWLIWAWITKTDDIVVGYEMIEHCELKDLAHKIKVTEKHFGFNMRKRFIDPNFGRKPYSSGSNISVMQELGRHGVSFKEANDDITLGHLVTRELLHYNKEKPLTAFNCPKLYFHKYDAPKTIHSMRNVQYEEWKGNSKNEKDVKEVEQQKDSDGAACVRYLTTSKPTYDKLMMRRRDAEQELEGPAY